MSGGLPSIYLHLSVHIPAGDKQIKSKITDEETKETLGETTHKSFCQHMCGFQQLFSTAETKGMQLTKMFFGWGKSAGMF